MIKFSVLLANYNNARYLEEAIDSVKDQTYKNWEIIIVDDGSTDGAEPLLTQLNEESQIKVFYNNENKGCGYTKRRCVEMATGEVCGFLDPDDRLHKEALEIMAEYHRKFPDCGLIHSNLYRCDENLSIKSVPAYPGELTGDESHLWNHKITAFSTFNKDSYKHTEGINSELKRAVDQDLYYKLEEVTKTKFIDQPLYFYRINEQGISTNSNLYKARYWHLKTALDACERRGISKEEYFEFFWKREEKPYTDSWEYKLGTFLLKPIRKVYDTIGNLYNVKKERLRS